MTAYLSVLLSGRNDDHAGQFVERLRNSIWVWSSLASQANLDLELILVEWNPQRDRPRLYEVFGEYVSKASLKIIEVPQELAVSYATFHHIAANVAARRAEGKFILSTTADIVPNEDLVRFLALQRLEESKFYRIDRLDTGNPPSATLPDFLSECERLAFQVHTRNGSFPYPLKRLGFFRRNRHRKKVHTNGCGDFTLVAKNAWNDLRGYPELTGPNYHVDSFMLHNIMNSGLKQEILAAPMKIYHQYHTARSYPMSLMPPELSTHWEELIDGRVIVLNGDNWGMKDAGLEMIRA